MICPNCGSEYREGYRRCADCDVDLIHPDSVGLIETDPKNELTRVLETHHHDFLLEVSFAFENNHIPFLNQSGTVFDANGVVQQNKNLAWRGALWVPARYVDEAKQIIEEIRTELPPPELDIKAPYKK